MSRLALARMGYTFGRFSLATLGYFSEIIPPTPIPTIIEAPKLGDDPGFNFTQTSITNINIVLKSLKVRLKSQGKVRTLDEYGNAIYKDCNVFNTNELVSFVCHSLTMFNEIPHLTFFTWEDTEIIEMFHGVLVQGALFLALGAQALIEKGREFNIDDLGIKFNYAKISELLFIQYQKELDNWTEKCTLIKSNMRSDPTGLSGNKMYANKIKHSRRPNRIIYK